MDPRQRRSSMSAYSNYQQVRECTSVRVRGRSEREWRSEGVGTSMGHGHSHEGNAAGAVLLGTPGLLPVLPPALAGHRHDPPPQGGHPPACAHHSGRRTCGCPAVPHRACISPGSPQECAESASVGPRLPGSLPATPVAFSPAPCRRTTALMRAVMRRPTSGRCASWRCRSWTQGAGPSWAPSRSASLVPCCVGTLTSQTVRI